MNRVRDSGVDLVLRSIEFSYTSQRQKFFKYDFECTHDLPEIDRDCETNYRLSPTVWRQNVGISITAFCTAKRFEDRENEYWADSDGLGLHFNLTTQFVTLARFLFEGLQPSSTTSSSSNKILDTLVNHKASSWKVQVFGTNLLHDRLLTMLLVKDLSIDEDVQCNESNDQRPRDSFLHNLEA